MADDCLTIQVERQNISFLKWIIEGYEHLGVITTLDNQNNILFIRSTPDMIHELKKVLKSFTFPITIIKS